MSWCRFAELRRSQEARSYLDLRGPILLRGGKGRGKGEGREGERKGKGGIEGKGGWDVPPMKNPGYGPAAPLQIVK